MRLKHLSLQGYKSFATRTEFEFSGGITAIVGPNGSGKSNVADAIRWVLGEQSMLALRGRSTADMIFSGGASRPRAGMAEVSLTFDNSDGWLPVEFVEVVLTRRAYRSGENEYLVNGARVRRRDLADMLAEGGLGRTRYVVVGQGLVDAALALRPQERRALFEDAAGIGLYRSRRQVTLQRLSETERNLERVSDIMSEIAPRLRRLEREARREQERQQIVEELNGLRRTWYGYQWGRSQARLGPARQRTAELASTLAGKEGRLSGTLEELALARSKHDELRSALRDWRRLNAGFRERSASLDRDLAVAQERSRLTGAQQSELSDELSRLAVQEEEQAARIAEIAGDAARLGQEHDERSSGLAQLDARWRTLRRRADGAADRHADGVRQARQHRTRLAALDERIQTSLADAARVAREQAAAVEQAQRLRARHEASLAEVSRVLEAATVQQARAAEAQARVEEQEHTLRDRKVVQVSWERRVASTPRGPDAPSPEIVDLKEALDDRRQRLANVDKALAEATERAARLDGELAALQHIEVEGQAQRAGLAATESACARGYHGPLSALISVPAEWESALEACLGADLNAIIIDSASEVDVIARAVRDADGHVVLLPLDSLKTPPSLPKGAESAANIVSHDPAVRKAVAALLGPIALCDSLSSARRLLPLMPHGTRCVTADAEILSAKGALSIGRVTVDGTLSIQRTRSALARRSAAAIGKRDDLRVRREALAVEVTRLDAQATDARRRAETASAEAAQAVREGLAEARAATALADQALRARRQAHDRELARATDLEAQGVSLEARAREALAQAEEIEHGVSCTAALETARRDEVSIDSALVGATSGTSAENSAGDVESLIEGREAVARSVADMEKILDGLSEERARARAEADEFERDQLASARTRLAVSAEALRNTRAVLAREETARQRLRTRRAELAERIEHLDCQRGPLAATIDTLQTGANDLEGRLGELRQRISATEDEVGELNVRIRGLEEAQHRLETQMREAEARHQQSMLDAERIEDRLRSLAQRIEQDLGLVDIDVAEAVTAQSPLPLRPLVADLPVVADLPPGLEEAIQRLRARERRYRGANPHAVTEYEETRERHQFLADQSDDLRKASAELHRAVSELDQLMASAFWETFEQVAHEFAATFPVLFGGGSAHLELTEPDDLLGTGVDVLARPPGKRGQRLAMLSGGERALTATALLFSLLKVSPTPFSVLDEVDATLDEANAGRFRVLLDDRAQATQFVVITHNRVTIEAADTIYGVSMRGDGVSQVVSMKLG